MYIAFKWLFSLSMAMWISMCFLDIYKPRNGRYGYNYEYISDMSDSSSKSPHRPRNKTSLRYRNWDQNFKKDNKNIFRVEQQPILINYLIFTAGALAVSIFHRKNEIFHFTKEKVTKFQITQIRRIIAGKKHRLKNMARKVGVTCQHFFSLLVRLFLSAWVMIMACPINFVIERLCKADKSKLITYGQGTENECEVNEILLKKIKEIIYKRKVINETVNATECIRTETTNRHELIRKGDEHNYQLRQANNLHHLYVITRHENIILKNRVKKISQEKNDVERNLVILINEVFCSNNNKLKSICSKFIVNTKNNLLNRDVKEEIKKFLENSCEHDQASTSTDYLLPNVESEIALYNESKQKSEPKDNPNFGHTSSDVVWTVKDRDGIIEKLYEYSVAPHNGGESVRRIREYSVYFEKDLIINRSIPATTAVEPSKETLKNDTRYCQSIRNRKFLTESSAFKKFLKESRKPAALME